jgi:ribonuclease BN (tRNA processing enzyme)
MDNRIVFLGTAGDSYVAGRQMRASGGIIVQVGELQFHIDPGPGALLKAIENNINLRGNTAVLVSNSSLLHCNDVNAVIDAMTYGGTDKTGVLVANKTVVNGAEGISPYLTELHKSFVERIIVMEQGQKLGIEGVEVHALPALSKDPNALGFKILAPDFTLVYSSDTKYSKDLAKEYKGADILILNVPHPGEEKAEGQLNSEAAARLIKAVNPKLAAITHFGISMVKGDPLYEGREIQKETGIQVLVAKDGMGLVPGSYAAKSDQKRLSGFKEGKKGIQIDEPEPVKVEEVNEADEAEETEESSEENKEDRQEQLF